MNADHMIDYALGRLEGADLTRMEDALRSDPETAQKIERLERALHLLLDDGDAIEPPRNLAANTLRLVAHSQTRSRSILDYVPARVPFRWADFAVAASIFIAGVLTLLPAMQRSRDRMRDAGCVFNLQQLGKSFAQYASLHPYYPYPPSHRADAPAGSFAAFLHDAGVLQDLTILDCPSNGPHLHGSHELPSFEDLDRIRRTDPERYRRILGWDYAYNVGYVHGAGRPGPLESKMPLAVPVVADQPAHDHYVKILGGNSSNHSGRGQNVLFSDGSVKWFRSRRVSPADPDLFLNNQSEVSPGLDARDSVLLPAYSPFTGLPSR
jgi:hypothetical protein